MDMKIRVINTKSSIKSKFMAGLALILIVTGILLNLLINQVLKENLENNIKTSMNDALQSSNEYTRYELTYKNLPTSEKGLILEVNNIYDYLQANYNAKSVVLNMEGRDILTNKASKEDFITNSSVKQAIKGASILDLKYVSNDLSCTFTFPLYINNNYIGLISMNKSYAEEYANNKKDLLTITLLEASAFLVIFVLSAIFLSHITKPLKEEGLYK